MHVEYTDHALERLETRGISKKSGVESLAKYLKVSLDEFLEFPKNVLENLRQPLEDGIIAVSRVAGTLNFPAKFP